MPKRLLPVTCFLALVGSLWAQTSISDATAVPTTKVPALNVTFENARLLSALERQQITAALRKERFATGSREENLSGLADAAAERVRAAYQDEGYFRVQAAAKAVSVAKKATLRYSIVIQVLEEGKQYRLGDLRITHMTAFSEQHLRDLFPIQRGEIFSRQKIAKGLEELRRFYGSQGYLNFVPVPNTEFDEEHSSVALEIDVDEGPLFRWGDLHAVGMRDQDQQLLLQAWREVRGQPYVYNDGTLQKFFGKFFRPLRKGTTVSDYTTVKVDGTGTVDVYLSLICNPDLLRSVGK